MNTRNIIPSRIKQARESREMSMLDLANRLDLSRQVISQYELGKTAPSMLVLNNLSSVLKYPVSFFYKEPTPESSANGPVFFRSRKTTRKKSKKASIVKIKIFGEIEMYLDRYVKFPNVNLPKFTCDVDLLDIDAIEDYALEVRNYWGLGNAPINNLIGTLEKKGISISSITLGISKIDGFSLWNNGRPTIFICNDKNSNAKIRFAASHEVAHLVLHSDMYSGEDLQSKETTEKLESEADIFAGAFLMPKETFSKDIYSSSIEHFIQLKAKWKTPIYAMIKRCEVLGLLSENQIKYLGDQMTRRGYWQKEPLDDMPVERPVAFKQAIDILIDNNIITPYKLHEDLGINFNELEEYCFLEKGYLAPPSTPSNIIQLKR